MTERTYRDINGNPIGLLALVRAEPEWATNRIRTLSNSLEVAEKMLEEIHTAAGIRRNGLAGILGWIDEARYAFAERRALAEVRKEVE